MKLYTKTGDSGTTSLISGTRVDKDDTRIEAYGTLDELSAHIGYLHDISSNKHRDELIEILQELMVCQALLAAQSDNAKQLPQIANEQIERLEQQTDALMQDLPELRYFTLPVGNRELSYTHICRTVCRRAERRIVTAQRQNPYISTLVSTYINRLSDYLYAFGRNTTHTQHSQEFVWEP